MEDRKMGCKWEVKICDEKSIKKQNGKCLETSNVSRVGGLGGKKIKN